MFVQADGVRDADRVPDELPALAVFGFTAEGKAKEDEGLHAGEVRAGY